MTGESDSVRPFPLPWSVHDNESCFWVESADGRRLAYVYFDERPYGIGTASASKLTRDEARRIASNIAKLPRLLQRS